ncbi:MAG TPA: hypothetical protein VK694_03475 [Verrucomicrobiae bacterium]|nr:hypothetical protein [Verrucomicrobiae bacterium]
MSIDFDTRDQVRFQLHHTNGEADPVEFVHHGIPQGSVAVLERIMEPHGDMLTSDSFIAIRRWAYTYRLPAIEGLLLRLLGHLNLGYKINFHTDH